MMPDRCRTLVLGMILLSFIAVGIDAGGDWAPLVRSVVTVFGTGVLLFLLDLGIAHDRGALRAARDAADRQGRAAHVRRLAVRSLRWSLGASALALIFGGCASEAEWYKHDGGRRGEVVSAQAERSDPAPAVVRRVAGVPKEAP